MGALDRPAAACLDRCRDAPRGDLAEHGPLDQDLPAGLVVVGGVQVHHRLGRQDAEHGHGIQGRRQQSVVALVGRGGQRGQRDAA
jgi:hypothetical protein